MPPKSCLWKYFEKCNDNKEYAKCRLCLKKIKTCGNTSNLNCHLKSVHKDIDTACKPVVSTQANSNVSNNLLAAPNICLVEKDITSKSSTNDNDINDTLPNAISLTYKRQKSIHEAFLDITTYQQGGLKYQKITNALLFMICRDYQPISIVEDEGFQFLIKQLSGGHYKIPSRTTIIRLLENKFESISNSFKFKMAKIEYFTITTDIWTDCLQSRSFLGITIHFEENSKIVCATLGVFELCEKHTAAYLTQELNKILEIWGLDRQNVTAVVSDGAKNITKSLENIFGSPKHIHCFAHQLNLLAQRALQSVESLTVLIKKLKDIVTWFKQSNNASDELRKAQPQHNIKKLVQEVPTRWNSIYYMIERFLELHEIINQIIYRHPSSPLMITAKEIQQLQEVKSLLLPLEAATKQIEGEKYTTTSLVIPMMYNLEKKISEISIELKYESSKKLKSALITECTKRFGSIEHHYILSIATILDPRFKKAYFKNNMNSLKAVEEITKLLKQNAKEVPNFPLEEPSMGKPAMTSNSNFDLWDHHKELIRDNLREEQDNGDSTELSLFLNTPIIPLEENPLGWWNNMANSYPKLCKIAIQFLSSVATSVPSERLFSKAGLTVTKQRNRLKGKRLSMLLFLQSIDPDLWEL